MSTILSGGCTSPPGRQADPPGQTPHQTATPADSTYPTGMHSCLTCLRRSANNNLDERLKMLDKTVRICSNQHTILSGRCLQVLVVIEGMDLEFLYRCNESNRSVFQHYFLRDTKYDNTRFVLVN